MPTASPPDRRIESALSEVRTAAYDLPNLIGGDEVRTGRWMPVVTPHAHAVALGQVHRAGPAETTMAIEASISARSSRRDSSPNTPMPSPGRAPRGWC